MHPAKSVIFFTVTSGGGYGLVIVLAVVDLFAGPLVHWGTVLGDGAMFGDGAILGGGTGTIAGTPALALGLVLVTAGFLSSTLHLANPRNAWRAIFRVRTSWLSREGLLALLFYPVVLLWGATAITGYGQHGDVAGDDALHQVAAALSLVIAFATLFSTGMIYACLRTIPQWHTALTPINYVLFGLMCGVLLALALVLSGDGEVASGVASETVLASWLQRTALVLLSIAGICKLAWYVRAARLRGPVIQDAIALPNARVRLLDVGHSAGTFLTHEFGFKLPRAWSLLLRLLSMLLAFVVPGVLLIGDASFDVGIVMQFNLNISTAASAWLAWLAALSAFLGLLVERYLFFSDATHVVNLYHGAQNMRR